MAASNSETTAYGTALGRLLLAFSIVFLFGILLLWRIDSPRVERLRMAIIDRVVPSFSWASAPLTAATDLVGSFQSYARIYEQNQELRRELQQMKAWKEAALQLEQENARLLDLNNVQLDPKFTHITGVVLADSGSPFRQTVLINVGRSDGIIDGWAAMDGIGLVGRISGVGESTSRVILLGDNSSRVPVKIDPSGQNALMIGDNTARPPLEFIENLDLVRPGDRIVTSGDGGVLPPGLLIGEVTRSETGRLRARLAADFQRLEFLRIIRHAPPPSLENPGTLIGGQDLQPPTEETVSEGENGN